MLYRKTFPNIGKYSRIKMSIVKIISRNLFNTIAGHSCMHCYAPYNCLLSISNSRCINFYFKILEDYLCIFYEFLALKFVLCGLNGRLISYVLTSSNKRNLRDDDTLTIMKGKEALLL